MSDKQQQQLLSLGLLVLLSVALGVSPPSHQVASLCDLRVCGCPLGGVKLTCRCDDKLQEILLQGKGDTYLPTTVGSISIENCVRVRVASNSLRQIRPLRSVRLVNIRQLDLEPEAFTWDHGLVFPEPGGHPTSSELGIDITILNSTLTLIPPDTFRGHINSIHLRNVHIKEIQQLAFANVAKMDKIEIINSHIESISPKAFSKFIVNNFIIEGGYIGRVPSYAMNSIEILWQLRFENVHFEIIYSSAFRISEPKKVLIRSCRMGLLEGEAFRISSQGQIFIEDNIIDEIHEGAFVGIHLDPRILTIIGTQEFIFENNTLTKFDEKSLKFNISGIKLTIDRIVLNKDCACNEIKTWSTKLVITSKNPTSYSKLMWCKRGKDSIVVYDYDMKHCQRHSGRINWALAGPILFLVTLLGISCLVFWCYRKRHRKYMNVPTKNNNRLSMLSQSSAIIDNLVIPQGKTYVETELNVLTESVEPIKEYVAPQTLTKPNKA